MENVEEMENQISVIEKTHKDEILSIHENLEKLVYDCNAIIVTEDDKETYDKAVELKRLVKKTHIAIESKRKELKQPLIDYGKRLDDFVKKIYEPLKQAENLVKQKMEVYEAKQEQLKKERKLEEEQKQRENEVIDSKLRNLNSTLEKINTATKKSELNDIMAYLDAIVLSEFGERSAEAGFILNQLKMTCSMASRLIKEEEPIVEVIKENLGEPIPEMDSILSEPVVSNERVVLETSVDEVGLFTSKSETISEENTEQAPFEWKLDDISTEEIKEEVIELSDDEILSLVDECSILPFHFQKEIITIIENYANNVIFNHYPRNKKINKEIVDLILKETVNRVGVKLSKYKS
jgi:hypothetical protein